MTEPFLPFARPSIGDAEKRAVMEVLESGWLTTGPRTHEFEEQFAAFVGSRHAVAVNSATAAMHLALEALGVTEGDEVIVPTWTFAATAEVVVYRGAVPVLVDIDPETLNVTADGVMAAVGPRTRAVIPVHIAGLPCAIGEITDRLAEVGIPVIEDAAHAFPSRLADAGNRYAGTIGAAGAYSFYATKTITTGEGGMLVTDRDDIADRARVMALHGISRDAWKRYTATGSWFYEIEDAGFKYNLTDIASALGLVQLARAEELLEKRRRIALEYSERLAGSGIGDLVRLPAGIGDPGHACHLFVLRLRLDRLAIDRASVIERLRERGIGTSVHFIPLHMHPYYRERWGAKATDFPVATAEYERVVSLPIWPDMTQSDVSRVVHALLEVLQAARR